MTFRFVFIRLVIALSLKTQHFLRTLLILPEIEFSLLNLLRMYTVVL